MEKNLIFSDREIAMTLFYVDDLRAVNLISNTMREYLIDQGLIEESKSTTAKFASVWSLTAKGIALVYRESPEHFDGRFYDEVMDIVMRLKDDSYGTLEYDELDVARHNDGVELAEKMLDLTAKISLLPADMQARLR